MKGTDQFTTAIKTFLEDYCLKDSLFIEKYRNPKKNIKDCVTYIINEVKKSGASAYAEEEIYQMALHYYDEEDIKVGNRPKVNIVSPTANKGTPVMRKITKSKQKTKPIESNNGQLLMF